MEVGGFPVWYGLLLVDPTLHVSSVAQSCTTSFAVTSLLILQPPPSRSDHQSISRLVSIVVMQWNNTVPVGERFPTPEALHESLEKIYDLALYEVSYSEPLKLRFITPMSFDEWLADESYNDYRLTTPEDYQNNMEYITVSYCWKQTQSLNNSTPLPRYQISCPSKTHGSTPISCPEQVFHRAMLFARSRKCPFVWIDQECIDQANPIDIQEHLKVMHRVYEESMWTVAPLEIKITGVSLFESTIAYLYDDRTKDGGGSTCDDRGTELKASDEYINSFGPWINDFIELLQAIAHDKWFTRTWAFQEKYCASSLHFMIPIDGLTEVSDALQLHLIGTDVCLGLNQIQDRLSRNHARDMDQVRGSQYAIWDAYSTSIRWCEHAQYSYMSLYSSVSLSENLVTADRVAIFGHTGRFRYRLMSNLLDSAEHDLITCLFALLFENMRPQGYDRLEHIKRYWKHHHFDLCWDEPLFYHMTTMLGRYSCAEGSQIPRRSKKYEKHDEAVALP